MDSISNIEEKFLDASPKLKQAVELIKQEVYRLVKSEEEAQEMFKQVLGLDNKRPSNWSPNSNAAYFKKKNGDMLVKWVTELENNPGKDLFLDTRKLRKSRESLIIQISQAWSWLIHNAKTEDEKEKYITQRASIVVNRIPEGLLLRRRDQIKVEDYIKTSLVNPVNNKDKTAQWKEEIICFLEKGTDGQELSLDNLRLQPHDIDWIQDLVKNTPGIFTKKIGALSVVLIKHMELWKKMQSM